MVAVDVFETMWALGVPSSDMTDLKKVEPFRVSTVGERLMLRKAMEDTFDVPSDGFIENPWGFPPMPLPVRRSTTSDGLIIAPSSISLDGLGHPIFWIDPSLTRRTDEEREHPERWGVRMFYLIMAIGGYDPDSLKWINIPRSQGVDYTKEDWIAYRQGVSSVLSTVRPLDESDLAEPMASINVMVDWALATCVELQAKVFADYRAELDAAYTTAVASTQGRSEWDVWDAKMKDATARIAATVESGAVPSSQVPEIYGLVDDLERVVKHTERCASMLSIPVVTAGSAGDSAAAAAAATALNAAKADVDVSVDSLKQDAHRLFELSSNSSPREFVRLHESATSLYMRSWRAMMVSARNLVRASEGQSAYQSWEALELVEDPHSQAWPPLMDLLAGLGR